MRMRRRKPRQKKELIPPRVKIFLAGLAMLAATAYFIANGKEGQMAIWSGVIAAVFLAYPWIASWKDRHAAEKKRKRYMGSSLYDIDHMEGTQFEEWAKAWYEASGYEVELTPDSNDYGADLIACNEDEFVVVQCKRYMGKVGVAAVQQAIGAVAYYKADRGEVMTNSYFTAQAKARAAETGIKLYDRDSLVEIPKLKTLPEHGAEGGNDG